MARFVVQWEYSADQETRYAARPDHRAHIGALAERGIVLVGGPLADDTGGIVIFDVADTAELQAHLDADPFTKAGVIARTTITEWQPKLGAWLS